MVLSIADVSFYQLSLIVLISNVTTLLQIGIVCNMILPTFHEYNMIRSAYGDQRAKRSGVPLINHIDEGLVVLDHLNASTVTQKAWCLHPLVQMDDDVHNVMSMTECDPIAVGLAIEYRSKANAYLCRPETDHYTLSDLPTLPLVEVKNMLIADKVQNQKDFLTYHYGTHPRSVQLCRYFQTWMEFLKVGAADQAFYGELIDAHKQSKV